MIRGGALLILGFTVGLTVGIVFSRLIEKNDEPSPGRDTLVFQADAAPFAGPEQPGSKERVEISSTVPPSPTRTGADPVQTEQLGDLHARLIELEAELERVQEELESHTGERLMPPANLDDRFGQPALIDAMTRAYEQQGVAGEVSSVDCTEYPCIVYGKMQADMTTESSLDYMLALLESEPMAGYREDGRQLRAMVSPPDDEGQASVLFAVSWYPKEDEEAREEEIAARFQRRFQEMFETGGLR